MLKKAELTITTRIDRFFSNFIIEFEYWKLYLVQAIEWTNKKQQRVTARVLFHELFSKMKIKWNSREIPDWKFEVNSFELITKFFFCCKIESSKDNERSEKKKKNIKTQAKSKVSSWELKICIDNLLCFSLSNLTFDNRTSFQSSKAFNEQINLGKLLFCAIRKVIKPPKTFKTKGDRAKRVSGISRHLIAHKKRLKDESQPLITMREFSMNRMNFEGNSSKNRAFSKSKLRECVSMNVCVKNVWREKCAKHIVVQQVFSRLLSHSPHVEFPKTQSTEMYSFFFYVESRDGRWCFSRFFFSLGTTRREECFMISRLGGKPRELLKPEKQSP